MFRNVTLGTKLFGGFIFVLLLMVVVAIFGYTSLLQTTNSLDSIVHQLEVAKKANTILTDAQDSQANALRFIIYKEDTYREAQDKKAKHVHAAASEAKQLMNSARNKQLADDVMKEMEEYEFLFVPKEIFLSMNLPGNILMVVGT